eukprot:UN00444
MHIHFQHVSQLITGEAPAQDVTCKIPLDFQRLLTLQYLDHDNDMNQGPISLHYGDELNVQVVLRDLGVESDGELSFGQYTWAGMSHVVDNNTRQQQSSTDNNKYVVQSYEVDYHHAIENKTGIMVKQNITGFIDMKATRYTNSSSVAQLHLLNLQNNTWLMNNVNAVTLDVVNSTTLISPKEHIEPLTLDLIYNTTTQHYYFEIPWSIVKKLNNNNNNTILDNYIALSLNIEFKTNVTKITPFALHWKLAQPQSPQRFTTYGTLSTLPRYVPDINIHGLLSEVSNTELTYNFNIIPVFGELTDDLQQNTTIINTFINQDVTFEHDFVVQMDYNSRELRPLDSPHPKSCNVHTIDEEGQIVEQLKVEFFFDQLYQQYGGNATKDNHVFINPHDSALIKVIGTKLNAKYAIEFSCTQKLHPGPKPALFIKGADDGYEEEHDQYITLLPHVYNKYTKLQGTKLGVVPHWTAPSETDIWPAWGVDYSKTGEKYKLAETIIFEHGDDEEEDYNDSFNGMGVYMVSNHKIHNYTEKMLFLNAAIEKTIEKAMSLFNITELNSEDFHPLSDVTNGGIAQNDHFDGSAINLNDWLFVKQNQTIDDDLQPRLNSLTQDRCNICLCC